MNRGSFPVKTLPLLALMLLGVWSLRNVAGEPSTPLESAPAADAPVRVVFKSYDGDPRKDEPTKMEFQIDTPDLRQPSSFLKMGETIRNMPLKLVKFAFKTARNEKIGEDEDVSELTVANVKTGQTVVLVYNRVTNVSAILSPATAPAAK
jgi:hypothetical protein